MSGIIQEIGVTLELTGDKHTRKVYYHSAFIGTLLFHDWDFKLDLGPAVPLRLEVAGAILVKAREDESIAAQKNEDERQALANA